jgi:predicted ester cyclase
MARSAREPTPALLSLKTYTSAFPDVSFEFRHKYACGEDVSIMEVTVRGTHQGELEGIPPTGRQIEGFLCKVIDVRDGKIYRVREYFDNLALLPARRVTAGREVDQGLPAVH